MAADPVRVMVATPLGLGGNGGIDRLMDSVREELVMRPQSGLEVQFVPTRGKGSILLSPFVLAAFLARMAAARFRGRLDLLHVNLASHGSTYRKLVIAAAARLLGIPMVLHLHGAFYRRFWGDAAPWLDRRITSMFVHAERILVLGTVWQVFVRERASSAKVTVLANAAPIPKISPVAPADVKVRLLFLGRVGPRKGVPELVEALACLAERDGWRATIAGDGELEQTRADIADHGLQDRVALPGWVGQADVAALLADADVLVLPSHDENLPMSVIEGMAAGLAVVATPVGAVEDIVIDGETGLLVPPGNAPALAEALRRVIEDPALRKRLGDNARAYHRERLDIVPYVDQLTRIWREAAA